MSETVQQIGEQRLLQRLQQFCPANLVGDDAAVLSVQDHQRLVVTTDMLVDGTHFSDRTTTAADAGWRAVAANLSDLAAMGAEPIGITVALGLRGDLPVAWVEALYQGMTECLQLYTTPIAGGDICRSTVTTIAITAFGQVLPQQTIRRAFAQPEDAIVVTGVHGASKAGLELLLHPEQGQKLNAVDRSALILAHQRPVPRLDAVERLRGIREQGGNREPGWRVAGMDSSDGLADAVLQICRASGVGAVLERQKIPLPQGLRNWVSEAVAIEWALYGGEDFELVLCLPLKAAEMFVEQLPGSAIVGYVTTDAAVVLRDGCGIESDQVLSLDRGFQHFG